MRKLFTRHASSEGVQEIIERLQKQVLEYQEKEKEIENEKRKYEKGIGGYVSYEYVSPIIDDIVIHSLETISLAVVVEHVKELDDKLEDCFVGIGYAVKVFDKKREITTIPILIEKDACFVSEIACSRRKKNLFLATKIAEYLKLSLEQERMLQPTFKEAIIHEELKVGKWLFYPELIEKEDNN